WRIKLRSILTIAGVVIAIATFVAMLSFGAGTKKHVTDAYTELGLFTTMNVYPLDEETDSVAVLDGSAVERLAQLPGVLLAYPFVGLDVSAQVGDTVIESEARVLSGTAARAKIYSQVLDGQAFSSDSAKEAFVTNRFLESLGVTNRDSLLGQRLIISAQGASLDSALINVLEGEAGDIAERLDAIHFDSLFRPSYRDRVLRRELNEGLRLFVQGLMSRRITVADTLVIKGFAEAPRGGWLQVAPILVPEQTLRRLSSPAMVLGTDPSDLFAAMRSGRFLAGSEDEGGGSFPQVTLELDPYVSAEVIGDSVEALGYRSFSYATEFAEMQRFFLYYNFGLAVIGLIALLTASLGIVNTMIMSIIERRREIGIFRALGADERQIKFMFLVESGVIGAVGAGIGILFGWLGTRIVSAIIKAYMESQGFPPFEAFDLPLWLILLALGFGTIVSLLAGLYPARRAARVDPVVALRAD
ncbi:MAG: FtsX-like permease family protein, partial [bacterium]